MLPCNNCYIYRWLSVPRHRKMQTTCACMLAGKKIEGAYGDSVKVTFNSIQAKSDIH